ncbi:penicillin-binding transpeptidase domain-containing protein [Antrihabitans cavernicola]|uniref:Penicillin-binding protein n=1 Tax=Antrihabitans cavernicola TaxID=2495913 RepID=A0A5A7S4J0_9NOCA|nr:penicillin-binding transpeptidase domain-containing protein [Spelaeibacter cavernicola]KAA0019503.1 penicillin-binding protein [Spelaeibacter cavernicola]
MYLLAPIAVVGLIAAGCSNGPDQPQTVAQQFVDALDKQDANAAAALTSDPAKAATAISQLFDGLGKNGKYQVQAAGDGDVTFDADWKLGDSDAAKGQAPKEWKYSTKAKATDTDNGWRIDWDPAVLAPGLTDGQKLQFTPTFGTPAKILDKTNRVLMSQQTVTLVNVDPTANLVALAALLTPISPDITAASLQTERDGAKGKPFTAISLRDQDIAPIADALKAAPGVTLAPQTRLLTDDKALASPTLTGVADLWQQAQTAAAGWAVQAVDANGTAKQLAGQPPGTTADISTTLDIGIQQAAEAALAPIPQQAAIVALQPSTGAVLAVAQNAPADAQGPIALTGLYPPGSTFKTVTVSAALQAGQVTPDTVLPCPGTENIEGRQIPNDDNFDLGQVPLHTAFARSCNTTMGRLAVGLPPNGLQKAAQQLGLGIDYVTPGLTTVTGSVPVADTPAQRVESGIGQGQVTASPFGMALVAASIARGSVPAPMMVNGQPGVGNQTPAPLPANIPDEIAAMMRETVTAGTATSLKDIPDLRGKTGTAEFDATAPGAPVQPGGGQAHGWFVGIDGDVAFAVFVAGGDSSTPAVDAAGRFLRPIQAQIPR